MSYLLPSNDRLGACSRTTLSSIQWFGTAASDNTLATPLADSNAVLADADSSTRSPDFHLMQQPAELARLFDLSACSRALTARLSTLPHGFAFVFAALCRAGCA